MATERWEILDASMLPPTTAREVQMVCPIVAPTATPIAFLWVASCRRKIKGHKKYRAHINIEWCNQSTSIKYLFKYINKGYDRVTAVMLSDNNNAAQNVNIQNDELKEYLDCR